MARRLIGIPQDQRITDEDGNIRIEWQRQFEDALEIVRRLADAIDAADGGSSGAAVDAEWNALVNAIKQD